MKYGEFWASCDFHPSGRHLPEAPEAGLGVGGGAKESERLGTGEATVNIRNWSHYFAAWWFGTGLDYDFPFSCEWNNHPNWQTHIFQRGRSTSNQVINGLHRIYKCWIVHGYVQLRWIQWTRQWMMQFSFSCEFSWIFSELFLMDIFMGFLVMQLIPFIPFPLPKMKRSNGIKQGFIWGVLWWRRD